MHCLGACWCGLRGRGCNFWPMGQRVAFVALVLPCGLLVCHRTTANSTSLALHCRFETGNRPADGYRSLQGLKIALRSRGSQPPSVLPDPVRKRKPCKTRRTRTSRATVPRDNPRAKLQRRARRARRVQGTMGGKGGHRGHAQRESQVSTVALTLKTQKPHKNNPGNGFGNPKNPPSQHFPTGDTGDARRPREPLPKEYSFVYEHNL